ncbi:MAG: protein translocase subunit SecF [Phycisphaerae bacterium]|nr:protein translocase subunit SecF [Phycisphaerae bacterium]
MEAVRGFAITLGLGVIFSMFTALLVTRWIFQTFMSFGLLKKSLPMLRLIPKVNINWMGKRYLFWGISVVMIGLGIGSMIWQGKDILGIEFSSGTEAIVKFTDDALIDGKLPNDGLVRTAIEKKIDGYKEKLQNKLAAETPRVAEEKSKLTTDLDELNKELGTHQARLTKAKADKADDDTLSTINRKVSSLESRLASLKKKIDTLDKTIATLQADIRGCTRFKETVRTETVINENNVRDFLKTYGNDKKEVTLTSWKAKGENVKFFNLLDVNPADGILTEAELRDDKLPQMSYQISTTESNAKLIREIINEVFGKALQRRLPCKFDLVKGETIKRLGLTLARDGRTFITAQLAEDVSTGFRDDLLDFQDDGGLMFVVKNVTPAISINDFNGRIRDIRLQPDFGRQAVNPYKVIGLTPAGSKYSAFVVLVRPANPEEVKNKKARVVFADGEQSVLTEALGREEAMVATNFDPRFATETGQLAIVVIVLSWLAIVGYLWLRFGSAQWGLAAVVCLVHDVIIVIGMVAVTGWLVDSSFARALGIGSFKIDLAMVAAILTVIGYSVNDTIVVFDRIRENRGKLKTVTINCINTSINQTLPRTLLTSFTTFIVVFVMYVWGGPGIKSFSFALLIGIIFGTYSSVAVASPLLLGFKHALVAKVTKEDTEG